MMSKVLSLVAALSTSLIACGGTTVSEPPLPIDEIPTVIKVDMTTYLPFGKHLVEKIIPDNQVEYRKSGPNLMQIVWGPQALVRKSMENFRYDDNWIYLDSFEWSDNGFKFRLEATRVELTLDGKPISLPRAGVPWSPRFMAGTGVYQLKQWGVIYNNEGNPDQRYAAVSNFSYAGLLQNPCFSPASEQTKPTVMQVESWLAEPWNKPGSGTWLWLDQASGPAFAADGSPKDFTGIPTRAGWMAEGIGHLWKFQEGDFRSCIESVREITP